MTSATRRRIAIASPYCWPEVRRGSERLMHELAAYLQGRGNDVTIISSARDPSSVEPPPGTSARVLRQGRLPSWPGILDEKIAFGFRAKAILQEGFDSIQCLSHFDGFAASRVPGRPRFMLYCPGIPMPGYFRRLPVEGLMFNRATRSAAEILVASHFAGQEFTRYWRRNAIVLPPPVALEAFSGVRKPDRSAMILFVGSADETRKGAVPLARAFTRLRRDRPDIVLAYSGAAAETTRRGILAAVDERDRAAIRFLGTGNVAALPQLYADAAVVALPSIWEAFGMVLVEALAAGTPVVGCDHGGIPDVIAGTQVGRMFQPGSLRGETDNVEGLVRALGEALDLAADPRVPERCRAEARRFGWSELGPRYAELLE